MAKVKTMHASMKRLLQAAKIARPSIETVADLARALNQSDQAVNNWGSRKTGVSNEGRLLAQKELGVSANWIEDGQGQMFSATKHELLNGGAPNIRHSVDMFADSPGTSRSTIRENDTSPGPAMQGRVPLISWDQARTWDTLMHSFAESDAERWLPCPAPHSAGTFCLRNDTETMDDGTSEGYREGEILFVDPVVPAEHGRDVIVIVPNGKLLFRRLKEDSEGKYLLALNGKKIERWQDGTVVQGVVIFSGVFR